MIDQLVQVLLIIALTIIICGYIVAFAITWRMIVEFRRWIRRYRASRKFWKSIERFRRDFK